MKWTNVFGLDAPLVDLITSQLYSLGDADVSVTGLLKPPLIAELERRHGDEIEVDVSEGLWRAFGTMMHRVLESHGHDDALHEETLIIERDGWRIGMHPDRYHDGVITDWKVTTKWRIRRDLDEWRDQLNLYALGLHEHGFHVHALGVRAILRDHHWSDAERLEGMPPIPFHRLSFPFVKRDTLEEFLAARIAVHRAARRESDVQQIAPCTPEERWRKGESYAVRKVGNKNATPGTKHDVSDFPDAEERCAKIAAEKTAEGATTPTGKPKKNPDAFEVIHTPGEDLRCKRYCAARFLCPFNREQPWSPSDALAEYADDPDSIPF